MALSDLLSGNTIWVMALLVMLASLVYWYLDVQPGVPPGPRGVPLLGFLPFLGTNPPATLSELSNKYGGVVSMYLGSRFVVVLNDVRALKEALVRQAETFSGRPSGLDMSSASGLVVDDGIFFRDHRRFVMHVLKDCGVGKSSLDYQIMDEIQCFMSEVKRHVEQPYDLRQVLNLSVANNVVLMMLGRRFDYDHPWLIEFIHNAEISVQYTSSVGVVTFLPWLARVPGMLTLLGQKIVLQTEKKLDVLLSQILREQEKIHKGEVRDNYFSAFKEEQLTRQSTDPEDKLFSDDSLKSNLRLFLIAGMETTATTLAWFLIYMMAHPDVQRKVQREIDEAIGNERLPCCQDQAFTPYTLATIAEVQRVSTLVPLGMPHRNRQECRVNGYRIPKDTFILTNFYHSHNDPKNFPDPASFRPERHLDERGKFVKPENMVVFSLGKRQCLGEPLARMELYLYVAAMMQTFDFRSPDGVVPCLDGRLNVTFAPKSFVTYVTLRHVLTNRTK